MQMQEKTGRNQSVECARLIASFFVVFVHCPFPGRIGKAVVCVGRFAVPMFFMISGYFSYQAGSKKLAVRVRRMLWLNLLATAVYVFKRYLLESNFQWGLAESVLELAPSGEQLLQWLILSFNPYSEHLWYLAAAWACYLVLWVYVTFFGEAEVRYQPLYGLCAGLFVLQFIFGEMAGVLGMSVPYVLYRNALLPGLPLFGLGLFLREYRERLVKNFELRDGKLLGIILMGMGYCFFWRFTVGEIDLPFGMILAVAALVLLLTAHPRVTAGGTMMEHCISKFGFLSAAVYILHQFFNIFYHRMGMPWAALVFGRAEPFLRPVIVLGITLAASILLGYLHSLGKLVCSQIRK